VEEGGGEDDEEEAYRKNLVDTTVSDALLCGAQCWYAPELNVRMTAL
jgi:hypothetical protein